MKIHDLAIIFIIIILPISIVLATYTQYQIQTINTQTLYDNKLASATYDAIRAIQINTTENDYSELSNSKIRDLEASVATFRNSIMSTFSLDGFSEDELNSYIEYDVKRSDIDVNKHMHNLNYLKLAFEALPEEVYYSKEKDNVRIMYKHQILLGDKVKCYYTNIENKDIITIKSKDDSILHAIVELS